MMKDNYQKVTSSNLGIKQFICFPLFPDFGIKLCRYCKFLLNIGTMPT